MALSTVNSAPKVPYYKLQPSRQKLLGHLVAYTKRIIWNALRQSSNLIYNFFQYFSYLGKLVQFSKHVGE